MEATTGRGTGTGKDALLEYSSAYFTLCEAHIAHVCLQQLHTICGARASQSLVCGDDRLPNLAYKQSRLLSIPC